MHTAISFVALAIALGASAGVAHAAAPTAPTAPAAPAANFAPPRAYAGYAQPEITDCTTVGVSMRQCVVPAMTAGRYLVVAGGTATSTGANATQSIVISLNGQACMNTKPVAFTGKKSLVGLLCEVTLLTDRPITVTATYSVANGTPDPAGPRLAVRRVPWNGIVEARGAVAQPKPTSEPAAK